MHAELVARMSKPLDTLINGKWVENEKGLVEWSEIDEGTFARFCEFAYTGDYQAAAPVRVAPPTPLSTENVDQIAIKQINESWLLYNKRMKTKTVTYDYSEVFLSHARLYAFADYYSIEDLMELSIRKLDEQMGCFNLHNGGRVTDVVQLIDFSYKNTRSDSVKQDRLRNTLSIYIARHIKELWPNTDFQGILESGGVAKDVIEKLGGV
ncbi:uncharacterized protein GGS22DRAFT_69819 [Annulohypoxylon maeteangense]|uniref:uncharacterized protein n=1 Tax=Annulohypoxylon maeteangense TaxID=1927788 RepID=UPI002007BECC|nr:uncharacterized protein GGS22DRAFT_69819 [Annulohypoxylon maeteangense]KAI0889319.1 hypothetical protein GGS22DRAFT_69819 [Annulohypoxylon maeteangense]